MATVRGGVVFHVLSVSPWYHTSSLQFPVHMWPSPFPMSVSFDSRSYGLQRGANNSILKWSGQCLQPAHQYKSLPFLELIPYRCITTNAKHQTSISKRKSVKMLTVGGTSCQGQIRGRGREEGGRSPLDLPLTSNII